MEFESDDKKEITGRYIAGRTKNVSIPLIFVLRVVNLF